MPTLTASYAATVAPDTVTTIRDALVSAVNALLYADGNPIDVTAAPKGVTPDELTLTADVLPSRTF